MASTTLHPAARASRAVRLGLRAMQQQEAILRCAAEVAHKSLTDFILDSACHAAEQTLLDQRLFTVSGNQYGALSFKCETQLVAAQFHQMSLSKPNREEIRFSL